jgi:hypothetical protein
MATTTNYSWTTPDDTALVKDGAAAIRSLGTAIDTTVFNNAGAAIAKTIVDAKGDIIAATAADTVSRLAVGTNDQVLTADSTAATGLKWAAIPSASDSFSLLNAGGTALTGSATTTISGISGKGTIYILIDSASSASASSIISIRLNGDSGNNYSFDGIQNTPNTTYAAGDFIANNGVSTTSFPLAKMSASASAEIHGGMLIQGCNSSGLKMINSTGGSTGSSGGQQQIINFGVYTGTSTISSVSVISGTGNFDAGKIYVYASA